MVKVIFTFMLILLIPFGFSFIADTGNQDQVSNEAFEYNQETGEIACLVDYTDSCLSDLRVRSCCKESGEILTSCEKSSTGKTVVTCEEFFCMGNTNVGDKYEKEEINTNLYGFGVVSDTCVQKTNSGNFNNVNSCQGEDCFILKNYCGIESVENERVKCDYGCLDGACIRPNC